MVQVIYMREIIYIIFGYLAGSLLFTRLSSRVLGLGDIAENSIDKNPGSANAFRNGGFLCGALSLCGDILKGFFPVWLYLRSGGQAGGAAFVLILAAPVIGHIFPVFYSFHGGKGIATSFGCLLGLLPEYFPAAVLACCFLFFSCIVRVTPNYHKTLLTYVCAGLLMLFLSENAAVTGGFLLIALSVIFRLLTSGEEKSQCKVGLLWMH